MNVNKQSVVLTLDAGGTNMVFSALKNYEQIVTPLELLACTDCLEDCLNVILTGFKAVMLDLEKLNETPIAISFAFPGPADYENGVIGDLPNFKAFRGGVALGPYLEQELKLPVFINNDGNLFAYGEALHGALPMVNNWLLKSGCHREYKNLIGLTFGTGFGCGVVINNILLTGDNGCGGDIWNFRNKKYPDKIVEESVSIRAVKRVYSELSGDDKTELTPKDIFDIAEGIALGDQQAAIRSFEELGQMAGDALAHMLTVIDGLVVIGGGLTGAYKYIMPSLMRELRIQMNMFSGDRVGRIQMEAFNLMDENEKFEFLSSKPYFTQIPYSNVEVPYLAEKKTGVMISGLGANHAIMCGAYAYALSRLQNK